MNSLYGFLVEAHDLGVYDEVLDLGLDGRQDVLADVGVLRGHVLEVAGVDQDPSVHVVHLAPQTVVLELAGEGLALEPLENDVDAFGGLREHRLAGDARRESAVLHQVVRVALRVLQPLDDQPVVRVLVAAPLERLLPGLRGGRVVWVLVDLEVRAGQTRLDRGLGAAHLEVAPLQEPDDHLGLEAGALEEQVVEDALLLLLPCELGQLVDLAEDVLELGHSRLPSPACCPPPSW